jgi:hypothetical protein
MLHVGWSTPEQRYWVIRPLVDAGLGLDRIKDLLFRLGFEAIVSEGRSTAASIADVVSDQPSEVQAAWAEVIGRMLTLDRSTS